MLIGHTRSIQVHLVAQPLVCWGLERLVQTAHPRLEVVGMAATTAESLPMLERNSADVVVLDLDGEESGNSVLELQARTRAKILVLTGSPDVMMLDRAVLAGVRGVVRKRESPATLLKAIEKVHEGELWIDRGATSRIFMEMARQKAAEKNDPDKSKIATLTMRERQTIVALASDASAPGKVIAGRLCISEHTLRNHLTSIYSKLGLSNRLDLYAYASKHSLNKPGG
jgi:DNA-binding NarL/FixJ family response regulator